MNALERFGLAGKTAVITGGARGIGYAVAELCAQAGADIAIIDVLAEQAEDSAKAIAKATGKKAFAFGADLADAAAAKAVVDEAHRALGRIDVLMNCVGIGPNTEVLDIPAEEWAQVMNVNVNAQFYVGQAVARKMADAGGGSIVAIGSNSGFIVDRPQPQAHYNASKAAVHQMVKSMAIELAPKNIRVNAVAPGYVITEMTKRGMSNPEWLDIWVEATPMGRLGKPEEIANVMVFLASDAASYMTGSIVLADGGYTCW
ncbi:glucose 1-dehydrogenase [Pelagibacterium montanilacus]|uniref:glucose 1-dehydrogenase n=1 Tax=Pelagibacterium montanilacus TaxID=2185280 RepID=UPI000F8DFD8C|nr:glucose 1-dehydrogenase [Pelagibacterium montanilacus]